MGWLILSHLSAAVLGAITLAVLCCLVASKAIDERDEDGVDGY